MSRILKTVALLTVIWVMASGPAYGGSDIIMTLTGKISAIKGMVLTLDRTYKFYPAREMKIPDFAVAGARVGLSYYIKNGKYYYYEIVKPGHRFKFKEALEKDKRTHY
jgi:hypothetical protein